MGNWNEGDICEIHDNPDECRESDNECGMDIEDEADEVCGIHLFSGICDESCMSDKEDEEAIRDDNARILAMLEESYHTGMIRL
jgi:hypothetical protein